MLRRRQFLKALGLGAVASLIEHGRIARADPATFPSRIVFYVQPHGHIPAAWNMTIPNAPPTDQYAEMSLAALTQATDLAQPLQPLFAFRDRLLVVEGLSHTAALADIAAVLAAGTGDLNNHQVAVADLLSGARALQQPGTYCTGGATTVDQVLATRLSAPGRFDSRYYGFGYVPNSVVSPFSYLGPGQATPLVSDPPTAFTDLLGYLNPASGPKGPQSRAALLNSLRPSVLDAAATEYALLAPQLDAEGRAKLQAHQQLVRELELSLTSTSSAVASPSCNTTFDGTPDATTATTVRQFMDLVRMAFSCDLTRIVTISAPVPLCPELGYPADATFHGYEHESIEGATACGTMYSPTAEQAIRGLDVWHAGHVAYLLEQLDSISEGSGTVLDHTVVVWIAELATGTHLHYDAHVVLAGGCNGFFSTGRYMRYPRTFVSPLAGEPLIGPAHNRLLVSLMQAMAQPDATFGMTQATGADGSTIPMTGPLAELQASP
jgi:hypothetical protein